MDRLGIGAVTTILFALSLPLLNKDFSIARLSSALGCLKPVTMRLLSFWDSAGGGINF